MEGRNVRTFKDSTEHEWILNLTVDCMRRIRTLTGVDLTSPLALDANKTTLSERLAADVMLRCDILFAAVSTQAATVNVSDEEFGRRLSPKVMRLATNVLWEELTDFFRELGQTEVAEAIQGILKLNETIRTRSMEKMGEIHLAITANVTAEMDLETAKILNHLKPVTRELPIGT